MIFESTALGLNCNHPASSFTLNIDKTHPSLARQVDIVDTVLCLETVTSNSIL